MFILAPVLALLAAAPWPGQLAQQPQNLSERDLQLKRERERPKATAPALPRGYALVIGIGKYKNLDPAEYLRFPETDAEAIYRVLISPQGGAFPAENVHKLIGPQATLAQVRRELEEWLPSVAGPQDRVVVYFAGHGFVYRGAGYLAPWDVDRGNIAETAYSMRTLGQVMGTKVKAQWKVLLADACHSAKITPETTNEDVGAELSKNTGFLTFTATTQRERSYEDPELATGFGLFSYFLVQGWQGNADADCDGRITADELIEYVRYQVRTYAQQRGAYQSPHSDGDYDPSMPLGISLACPQSRTAMAGTAGGLIIEVNMDNVDIYIDDKLIGTVSKDKPLPVPGLSGGEHVVTAVHKGYEPEVKHVLVAPGEQRTVTVKIRYAREIKRSALELYQRGSNLLYSKRSGFNPLSIYLPRSQSQADLQRARDLFTQALAEDPHYSQAAYSLGVACQLLSDSSGSQQALKRAIELDPSYVDARTLYAAVLIEEGDPDESIRQLTEVMRLDPTSDLAYSMLARAYWEKEVWDRSLEAADAAIRLNPSNDQARLWKAEALRHLADKEAADRQRRADLLSRAGDSYRDYLRLSNFSTPVYEWIAFKAIGFHLGSRRHADRKLSWENQRGAGFLGLCICENALQRPLRAREYCQRAIGYDPKDAVAYFLLGNVYRDLFNADPKREYLLSARDNYTRSVTINPDLEFAKNARNYIDQIDSLLQVMSRSR